VAVEVLNLESDAAEYARRTLPRDIANMSREIRALARARRVGSRVAVLCIDLDRFKTVSETLGHAFGDALLQRAAERIDRELVVVAEIVGEDLEAFRSLELVSRL